MNGIDFRFNYVSGLAIGSLNGVFFSEKISEEDAIMLAEMYGKGITSEQVDEVKNLLFPMKKIEKDGWKMADNGSVYHEFAPDIPVPMDMGEHIKRHLEEENDTMKIVNFWLRLVDNRNQNLIPNVFKFINANNLTVTEDGSIIGKKKVIQVEGIKPDESFIEYELYLNENGIVKSAKGLSVSNSMAKEFIKWINQAKLVSTFDRKTEYKIGGVTALSRDECEYSPEISCGSGLHIGGDNYINNFGGNIIIMCKFDPADIISIPYNEEEHKVRVCKLITIGLCVTKPLPASLDYEEIWYEEKEGEYDY